MAFELYASPLNCFYGQYCSAFADTDACFGSRGPVAGANGTFRAAECNPPFAEACMLVMVQQLNTWLQRPQPMSVVVVVPSRRTPPSPALLALVRDDVIVSTDVCRSSRRTAARAAWWPPHPTCTSVGCRCADCAMRA